MLPSDTNNVFGWQTRILDLQVTDSEQLELEHQRTGRYLQLQAQRQAKKTISGVRPVLWLLKVPTDIVMPGTACNGSKVS